MVTMTAKKAAEHDFQAQQRAIFEERIPFIALIEDAALVCAILTNLGRGQRKAVERPPPIS